MSKILSYKEIGEIAERISPTFKGYLEDLERSIGMMYLARAYGWKVLYLGDSRAYIKKCEGILGVDFKTQFPEETEYSKRALSFRLLKGVTNFWKAVKGEIPDIRSNKIG